MFPKTSIEIVVISNTIPKQYGDINRSLYTCHVYKEQDSYVNMQRISCGHVFVYMYLNYVNMYLICVDIRLIIYCIYQHQHRKATKHNGLFFRHVTCWCRHQNYLFNLFTTKSYANIIITFMFTNKLLAWSVPRLACRHN